MSTLFLIGVCVIAGAFIGWHFPQPDYAVRFESWVKSFWKTT